MAHEYTFAELVAFEVADYLSPSFDEEYDLTYDDVLPAIEKFLREFEADGFVIDDCPHQMAHVYLVETSE